MACEFEGKFDGEKLDKAKELKALYDAQESLPRMSKKKKAQQDIYADAAINPLKYAEKVIEQSNSVLSAWMDILGGSVIRVASPAIKSGHKKLAKESDFYRDTIHLIREGFTRSGIAQRMASTLDIAGDVDEKMVSDMLQLHQEVVSESRTYLEDHLPKLERKLDDMYPDKKDRILLNRLFGRTGIANLYHVPEVAIGIINGKMTIDEALAIVEPQVKLDKDANEKLDDIVDGYLNGVNETGYTNPSSANLIDKRYKTIVALRALKKLDGAEKMLKDMDLETKQDLYARVTSIRALSDVINERQTDEYGKPLDSEHGEYREDYDGHMMKDLYEGNYEYVMVTEAEMKAGKYKADDGWKVLVKPDANNGIVGFMAREDISSSKTPGIGLEVDRFNNGFYLDMEDSKALTNKLDAMANDKKREDFLKKNNLVKAGQRYRLRLSEKVKTEQLGMKESLAHTLMRTFVHNKELIEMQSVRDIVMDKATETIKNEDELARFNRKLGVEERKHAAERKPMPMFIKLDMEYDSYDELPAWVKRRYTPATGLSTLNGFNKRISLVRKSREDELLGHPNFSIVGKNAPRSVARLERYWKELVVMAKQKMVILDPGKLAKDAVSNVGLLAIKDVGVIDMARGFTDGMRLYKEFSDLRTELVNEKLKMKMGDEKAKSRITILNKKIKEHGFYDSFKAGFVQSYSTSLVVKEFDTLSGLQTDIDALIDGLTKSKKGDPNIAFEAIKKWQKFGSEKGFNIDGLLKSASKLSKVNGTAMGEEMMNMAERMERNRKDPESVARYINELIGGPASEAIRLGGAVMVTMDTLSKYTLATTLVKKKNIKTGKQYTKDEAYTEANNTFIDYRRNLPREVKALSDYGILMFPSFWIKAQKVIVGLVHYHPSTAITSYMIADALDISSATFLDVNIINKISDGTVINEPTNLVDWGVLSHYL